MKQAADVTADPRWAAVVGRVPSADGRFVYAVRTTGVYCRPSCCARMPRPENVEFYATTAEAARAGFRACRRCRPDGTAGFGDSAASIATLCRAFDTADDPPALQALAAQAGVSPFHLHRRFKAAVGVTPGAYVAGRRAERVRRALRSKVSVTEAIYAAGYGSAAAFYRAADGALGMTPAEYRAGGAGVTIRFVTATSSLGLVLVAATERGVCGILIGDDDQAQPGRGARALVDELGRRFPRAARQPGGADMKELVAAVLRLIEEPADGAADLPLDVRGTAFQLRVWQALTKIPAGQTVSYAQLAAAVGSPNGARAVAAACASNHLAVVIPCHRVVRGDGALSGYRWGVARKRALLERERATKPSKP
ncbi:MAG: bifunctional DNA-binding transcriptional regulator/O6-methylguanine-DNA methyltransferase Ada [Pseudomonadota bacterium]